MAVYPQVAENVVSPAEAADLFRLLVGQVRDYAIFVLDTNGIVISWNAGAERIKGYKAGEIIGHHFSRFYPEEAIRSGWPQTELDSARRDGRFEDEGWRLRKDGTRFWANVIITALYREDGTLRGFAKVTRDLTERRRAERLEADARQMSEFLAMLGHELRNPLAPITSAVTLAQRSLGDGERVSWALGVIGRQAAHMTRLVDDLLDMSRISRGQVRLERRRLIFREAIERAVEAVRPDCEQRGHQLDVNIDSRVLVRGDGVRLTQIITNLLVNASKYTPDGGRISVTLTVENEQARLSICDTGIGIAPDLLPRIFDIFTQGDRGLDRKAGGLGLGLAIAKRLVDMHGGHLAVRSAGPGCGSEFVVTLPVFACPGETETESPFADQLTVLVVDDNIDAAQVAKAMLESSGHRVIAAYDGETGLAMARNHLPDVIILDIGLPRMNGYELARQVRRIPELEGVTLVAITGYGTEEDRRTALEAGFDLHAVKPIDYDQLQLRLPVLAAQTPSRPRAISPM
ncbi:hybrid sensor histidine kinase/response regulator [Tahibacter amnicola]|uniref:histidine kinase n=1 Tax=Tahibacter amnicola TaxID=2976241 RepID=A0ABY6B881_9GAMM|nr:ATP-binding protein [Tahibacter amnicola]UXI66293.1 ATP-binding protein [Tahibacter amnicola]